MRRCEDARHTRRDSSSRPNLNQENSSNRIHEPNNHENHSEAENGAVAQNIDMPCFIYDNVQLSLEQCYADDFFFTFQDFANGTPAGAINNGIVPKVEPQDESSDSFEVETTYQNGYPRDNARENLTQSHQNGYAQNETRENLNQQNGCCENLPDAFTMGICDGDYDDTISEVTKPYHGAYDFLRENYFDSLPINANELCLEKPNGSIKSNLSKQPNETLHEVPAELTVSTRSNETTTSGEVSDLTPISSIESNPPQQTPINSIESIPLQQTPIHSIESFPPYQTPISSIESIPSYQTQIHSIESIPPYQTPINSIENILPYQTPPFEVIPPNQTPPIPSVETILPNQTPNYSTEGTPVQLNAIDQPSCSSSTYISESAYCFDIFGHSSYTTNVADCDHHTTSFNLNDDTNDDEYGRNRNEKSNITLVNNVDLNQHGEIHGETTSLDVGSNIILASLFPGVEGENTAIANDNSDVSVNTPNSDFEEPSACPKINIFKFPQKGATGTSDFNDSHFSKEAEKLRFRPYSLRSSKSSNDEQKIVPKIEQSLKTVNSPIHRVRATRRCRSCVKQKLYMTIGKSSAGQWAIKKNGKALFIPNQAHMERKNNLLNCKTQNHNIYKYCNITVEVMNHFENGESSNNVNTHIINDISNAETSKNNVNSGVVTMLAENKPTENSATLNNSKPKAKRGRKRKTNIVSLFEPLSKTPDRHSTDNNELIIKEEVDDETPRSRSLRSRKSETSKELDGAGLLSDKHIDPITDDDEDIDDSDEDPVWTPVKSSKTPKGLKPPHLGEEKSPKRSRLRNSNPFSPKVPKIHQKKVKEPLVKEPKIKEKKIKQPKVRSPKGKSPKRMKEFSIESPNPVGAALKISTRKNRGEEDFYVEKSEVNSPHPAIWRLVRETSMLQRFEHKEDRGENLYESTLVFGNWYDDASYKYIRANVNTVINSRVGYVVEYVGPLELDGQKTATMVGEAHASKAVRDSFDVYLQSLTSQALDANFISEIYQENDVYFLDEIKAIENINDSRKKLIDTYNWDDAFINNIQTFPEVAVIAEEDATDAPCQICTTNLYIKLVEFCGQPYDWMTLQPVPLMSNVKLQHKMCGICFNSVVIYSSIHHHKYKLYRECVDKVNLLKVDEPEIHLERVLEICLGDRVWANKVFQMQIDTWDSVKKSST